MKKATAAVTCQHDVAQWVKRSTHSDHQLQCSKCLRVLDREFGAVPRQLNVVLFRNVQDGGYAPFNPKGWM